MAADLDLIRQILTQPGVVPTLGVGGAWAALGKSAPGFGAVDWRLC